MKKILLEREVAGSKMIVPEWAQCLEYDFQLRKEALRLVREEGQSIEKAFWGAYHNPHHRIEHWLTLLTIANSGATKSSSSSSSLNPADQRLQKMEQKVAELQRSLQRSRSPRMKTRAIAAPQNQLALPAPHTPKGQGKRGKGKNGKGKGKASKDGSQATSTKVDQILANLEYNRQFFHKTQNKKGICYIFQKGQCPTNPCPVSEITFAWDAANQMFSMSLAGALTMWWSSEQGHSLLVLRMFYLRRNLHCLSIRPSKQYQ